MLQKDYIINKTRCLLHEFISPIAQKLDKSRKKFLHLAVGAILLTSAIQNEIKEVHCYDKDIGKYADILDLKIVEPYCDKLPFSS